MISVTRITGEGFDLALERDVPAGLVLSNGKREVTVYLPQDEIRKVVELYVEETKRAAIGPGGETRPSAPPEPPQPKALPPDRVPNVVAHTVLEETAYSDPDTGTESV